MLGIFPITNQACFHTCLPCPFPLTLLFTFVTDAGIKMRLNDSWRAFVSNEHVHIYFVFSHVLSSVHPTWSLLLPINRCRNRIETEDVRMLINLPQQNLWDPNEGHSGPQTYGDKIGNLWTQVTRINDILSVECGKHSLIQTMYASTRVFHVLPFNLAVYLNLTDAEIGMRLNDCRAICMSNKPVHIFFDIYCFLLHAVQRPSYLILTVIYKQM